MLACALLPRRQLLLAALAIPLLIWQWYPAVDGIAYAPTDPSTRAVRTTRPSSRTSARRRGPIGRVEIPSTYRHWEAAYAAPAVLLARGWERQLDIAYNPIFYSEPLTAESYHDWLTENGVEYVALPDARLDDSSLGERALLERGLPYLERVWRDAHWQRVARRRLPRSRRQVPRRCVNLSPDRFTLQVHEPGDVLVRIHATRHWTVERRGGCRLRPETAGPCCATCRPARST